MFVKNERVYTCNYHVHVENYTKSRGIVTTTKFAVKKNGQSNFIQHNLAICQQFSHYLPENCSVLIHIV